MQLRGGAVKVPGVLVGGADHSSAGYAKACVLGSCCTANQDTGRGPGQPWHTVCAASAAYVFGCALGSVLPRMSGICLATPGYRMASLAGPWPPWPRSASRAVGDPWAEWAAGHHRQHRRG